jgi:hypothetical protein
MTARPVPSISDIIDRAILAEWACRPYAGKLIADDVGGLQGSYTSQMMSIEGDAGDVCLRKDRFRLL